MEVYHDSKGRRYTISDDGSMKYLEDIPPHSQPPEPGGGNNEGCLTWGIIIAVIIIVIFLVSINNSNKYSNVTPSPAYGDSVVAVDSNALQSDTSAPVESRTQNESSYLNVSTNQVTMDATGGSIQISVSTDGSWTIGTSTADWGELSINDNSVVLNVRENTSSSSRRDWFTVKAGSYEERINILQYGSQTQNGSANIERIWCTHSEYQNGVLGMKIHVKFSVMNKLNETIYVYAYMFQGDNSTPLHDRSGNNLKFHAAGTPNYNSCEFSDFVIFVPLDELNMAPNLGSIVLSFDIVVSDASGNELDRRNNTTFIFRN